MLQKTKKLNVPSQKEVIQIKITLIGDCQSGKTSFANRYLNGNCLNYYQPTLGCDSVDKYVNLKGQQVHVTFWDMSGRMDFLQIRNQVYKESHLIIVFVDLSNKTSVDGVDYWLRQIKDNNGACPVYIVGNKMDNKKVNANLTNAARERDGIYTEISCKTGQGIELLMQKIVNEFK